MILDIQKAGVLKRISAFLLDVILLCILVTGFAFGLSAITGYDSYNEKLDAARDRYEKEYDVSFDLSQEEYSKLTDEQKATLDKAFAAFGEDEEVVYLYNMQINLILLISSISIFLAYFILEFIVPLLLKNGQTVGKKIFGLALMRTDGVRLSAVSLFARTVLGKYTLETMVPVAIVIMIFLGSLGITGTVVLLLLLALQVGVLIYTKTNSSIHDLLAASVVVELSSQMIFDSEEAMMAYKKKIHADAVERAKY
jgi:uncharacterized RDD family membrane protein YckC